MEKAGISLRQLEVFRAVMEEGSATAAARRLGLSQPAISQHLAQLENELGLVLFVRESGRLKATDNAIAMHDEVTHAFDGLDRVLNFARTVRGSAHGTLRIGCPHSVADGLIPRVAGAFQKSHPRVRIALEQGNYSTVVGMVASRSVDFGIAKGEISHPGVVTRPLIVTRTACAIPVGHRLADKNILSIADLEGERLIMLGQSRPWRYEVESMFRKQGVIPIVQVEAHSVSAACSFVSEGFGVALVPSLLARHHTQGKNILLRAIDIELEHRFCAVLPAFLTPSTLTEDFLAELLKEVSSESATNP
jgi:DNA-binding transcriptional LysR family regulator